MTWTPRCGSCLSYRARSDAYGFCWEPRNGQYHLDGRIECYPVVRCVLSSCEHFRDRIANRDEWMEAGR